MTTLYGRGAMGFMLITKSNFDTFVSEISDENVLALDTETTGVWWWKSPHVPWYKPRVFSVQISSSKKDYYLDFEHSNDKLDDSYFKRLQDEIFSNPNTTWAIHNAKFDMHQLANHGVDIRGTVHCTLALARVADNREMALGLGALGEKYHGVGKDPIKEYILEHNLFTDVKKFGRNLDPKKATLRWLHFDRVPLDLMYEYGTKDTRLCFKEYERQIARIKDMQKNMFNSQKNVASGIGPEYVMRNEYRLTKVLFQAERRGIQIDIPYTYAAYNHAVDAYEAIKKELDSMAAKYTGKEVLNFNSGKQLQALFDAMGEPYEYTEKGNACFDSDALEASESLIAKKILEYRFHQKRAHTYYQNYIWLADENGVLHADGQQNGTRFGRMSYWDPNLQNIPKRRDKDAAQYKMRKCFVTHKNNLLVELDLSGAEYRVFIDYSGQQDVASQIIGGEDPHANLCVDLALASRDAAKTMQFRILYGAGFEAIGRALQYPKGWRAKREGKRVKFAYFNKLKKVDEFISSVKMIALKRGYLFNRFGRVFWIDRDDVYKGPNNLIQGTIGDTTKMAMVAITEYIEKQSLKTKIILQVHDSIVLDMPPHELAHIPHFQALMERAYEHDILPMKSDCDIYFEHWTNAVSFDDARKRISDQGFEAAERHSALSLDKPQ